MKKLRAWYSVANIAHVATIFFLGMAALATWAALDVFVVTRESSVKHDIDQVPVYPYEEVAKELKELGLSVDDLSGVYWVAKGYHTYPVLPVELATTEWQSFVGAQPGVMQWTVPAEPIDIEGILERVPDEARKDILQTLPGETENPSFVPVAVADLFSQYEKWEKEREKALNAIENLISARRWATTVRIWNAGEVDSGPIEVRIVEEDTEISVLEIKNLYSEDGRFRATSVVPGAQAELRFESPSKVNIANVIIDAEDRKSSFTDKSVIYRWAICIGAITFVLALLDIMKQKPSTNS